MIMKMIIIIIIIHDDVDIKCSPLYRSLKGIHRWQVTPQRSSNLMFSLMSICKSCWKKKTVDLPVLLDTGALIWRQCHFHSGQKCCFLFVCLYYFLSCVPKQLADQAVNLPVKLNVIQIPWHRYGDTPLSFHQIICVAFPQLSILFSLQITRAHRIMLYNGPYTIIRCPQRGKMKAFSVTLAQDWRH